jgi:hypothetical protein
MHHLGIWQSLGPVFDLQGTSDKQLIEKLKSFAEVYEWARVLLDMAADGKAARGAQDEVLAKLTQKINSFERYALRTPGIGSNDEVIAFGAEEVRFKTAPSITEREVVLLLREVACGKLLVGRCPVCKGVYEVRRSNQKVCSERCLNRLRARRGRERKKYQFEDQYKEGIRVL